MEKNPSSNEEIKGNSDIPIDIKRFGHTMTLSKYENDLLVSK
jgi:hypothetical protein